LVVLMMHVILMIWYLLCLLLLTVIASMTQGMPATVLRLMVTSMAAVWGVMVIALVAWANIVAALAVVGPAVVAVPAAERSL
jgi:hypothetical protein